MAAFCCDQVPQSSDSMMKHISEPYSQVSLPTILTDFYTACYILSVKILIRNSNIQIWVIHSTWLKHSLPKINGTVLNSFLLSFLKVLQKSEVTQWDCSYTSISFVRFILKYYHSFVIKCRLLKGFNAVHIKISGYSMKNKKQLTEICSIQSFCINFLLQSSANCNLSICSDLWHRFVFFSRYTFFCVALDAPQKGCISVLC